jgi:hypothetical protein
VFSGYQDGDTYLDPEKLSQAEAENGKHFLTIMVSDGNLHNNSDAERACRRVIDKKNDFVLIQVKSSSEFANDMREAGAAVKHLDKPKDLVGLVLDVVSSKYAPQALSSARRGSEAGAVRDADVKVISR